MSDRAADGGDEQQRMQAAADRLSAKLPAFHAALPEEERQVMTLLFRHFATSQTEVGSGRAQLRFALDTEALGGSSQRTRPDQRRRRSS